MASQARPGAVYWIDHYTVGTNDLPRWIDFHERVLGAESEPAHLPRTPDIKFQYVGICHHGGFLQKAPLPPPAAPGEALPRYAWFVRPEEIDAHVRRLDAEGAPHSAPIRTSATGADGIAVYFTDLDGNQFELWAPAQMPEGAMDRANRFGIGRISHVTYESRDLARSAAFFERYCMLEPLKSGGLAPETLVLPLAAGACRLIFKRVETLGHRTSGRGVYRDMHTALVVREEDLWPNYERVWAGLPEWDYDARIGPPPADGADLPARSALHGSPAGRSWKAAFGRGDDWYDWDANLFHYLVGIPRSGTMRDYEPHTIDDYAEAYLAARGLQPAT
jgi:predicted enzyme related to lactoylglutathione lyase